MSITADDIWAQFMLEEDVPDLTDSIKFEWINVLNQDLYRAMFLSDPEPYTSEATIAIGSISFTLTTITGTFTVGETVTGATSHVTGVVVSWSSPTLVLSTVSGTFTVGETMTGGTSAAHGVFSTSAVITTFDLPADFEEVAANGCGLFLYDSAGVLNQTLVDKPKGSPQDGFYLNNVTGKIHITGSPSTGSWTLRYIPRVIEITTGTQTLVIPNRLQYKCKRIFFFALSEMYKDRDERSIGEIYTDQIYKKDYYDSFKQLFEPVGKTLTLNTFQSYYDSRNRRRTFRHYR